MGKKSLKVKNAAVVERRHHADIVKRRGVALKVLDGVGVGVKDIRVLAHRFRQRRDALQQIVIVRIHTGNHATAQARPERIG